jgi:hypothetical protein
VLDDGRSSCGDPSTDRGDGAFSIATGQEECTSRRIVLQLTECDLKHPDLHVSTTKPPDSLQNKAAEDSVLATMEPSAGHHRERIGQDAALTVVPRTAFRPLRLTA